MLPRDQHQRTSAQWILAIGDVTGAPLPAHVATHQRVLALELEATLYVGPNNMTKRPNYGPLSIDVTTYGMPRCKGIPMQLARWVVRSLQYQPGSSGWGASD